MMSKWKIATLAALIAAGVASPAFAQSADHTGSQLPNYYDTTGKQTWGTWGPQATAISSRHAVARRGGLYAYARVPELAPRPFATPALPGGSIGYDQNLRTDQW
jgi:hypothetical protein